MRRSMQHAEELAESMFPVNRPTDTIPAVCRLVKQFSVCLVGLPLASVIPNLQLGVYLKLL